MKLTNELIFQNILQLQQAEKEGVNKDKFIDHNGAFLKDSDFLIAYLLKYDLIETEEDENVFFLTDVGYKVLEIGGWYDADLVESNEAPESRELKYSSTSDEEKKKPKKPYLTSLKGQAVVLSILVGIGSFFYALDYSEVVDFFGTDNQEEEINDSLSNPNESNHNF